MYETTRVDMITNQADKQKLWEVMKSCQELISFHLIDLSLSLNISGVYYKNSE